MTDYCGRTVVRCPRCNRIFVEGSRYGDIEPCMGHASELEFLHESGEELCPEGGR